MQITFFEKDILVSCKQHINDLAEEGIYQSVLILSCDGNRFSIDEYNALCRTHLIVFGGIFPQLVYQNKNYEQGMLVVGFKEKAQINTIKGLSEPTLNIEAHLDPSFGQNSNTIFTFVDGFARGITEMIDSIFSLYGLSSNFIGGGAGSLDFIQKPCILSNAGVLQDAAILAALNIQSSIGVRHGWKDFAGPFKVTKSKQNTIYEINNQKAIDIYKAEVEADANKEISIENFFSIAKSYPFGLVKVGSEKIVRDPFTLNDDGSINCVGEVPSGSLLYILKGKKEELISASKEAKHIALTDYNTLNSKNKHLFIINCISRMIFLEDMFSEELIGISEGVEKSFGALTIGEIANSGDEYLEFYNKTSVVCMLDRQ